VELNNVETLDYNYTKGKIYSDSEMELLSEHWKNLYDEFYELRDNKSGKYTMNKNIEISRLALILDILADIENRLIILNSLGTSKEMLKFIAYRTSEAINDLKKLYPKVRAPLLSSPLEVLSIVQSVIKSQVNIYDEKVGVKETTVTKQKETIFDVVAIMSRILGYRLYINSMSCMEFIGHENAINTTNKNK
jgi:hypothetical protein